MTTLVRLYESGMAVGRAMRAALYFPTRSGVVIETPRGTHTVPECEMLTGLTPAGVVKPRVDNAYILEDEYEVKPEPSEFEDADDISDGNILSDQEVLGMPRRVLSGIALGALGVLLGIVLGASILIVAAWLLSRVGALFGG